MEKGLARSWRIVLIRGLCSVAVGLIIWSRPRLTVLFLIFLFGLYAIEDGVSSIASAVRASRGDARWWPFALEGAFGIAIGVLVIIAPTQAAVIAFIAIALWSLITGFLELVEAFRLRQEIPGEWLLGLNAVVRLVFGLLLLTRPNAGFIVLASLTAFYALSSGFILIGLSLVLRRHLSDERRRLAYGGGISPLPT